MDHKDYEIDRLTREVIAKGPGGLLPQNLSDEWLNILGAEANCLENGSGDATCLTAIVTHLVLRVHGNDLDKDSLLDTLEAKVPVYVIAVAIERLYRSGYVIQRSLPTVEDVLDGLAARMVRFPSEVVAAIAERGDLPN